MKGVENSVANEEIDHCEQVLLFLQQHISKSSAAEASQSVCMWERVK